jgi:hypothetical protein
MHGAIPPNPQYAFMPWCSVKKKHRDNFTFTFKRTRTSRFKVGETTEDGEDCVINRLTGYCYGDEINK